jgi:hypothetical protein
VPCAKPEKIKEDGQDHNRSNRNGYKCDCQEREQKRDAIETDQTPFLPLFIDEIERIKERYHTGISAPQGNRRCDDKGQSELVATLPGDTLHLFAKELNTACR